MAMIMSPTFPRPFLSKHGEQLRIERLGCHDAPRLSAMYLAYQPRNSIQGLPPLKDEACNRWVQEMILTGTNLVAIDTGGAVVAHTAIFEINAIKCELLVVVSPAHQNAGVGTALVRAAIDEARHLGFHQIWLPVDATNVRARHVYRKCGFEYAGRQAGRELDMVRQLSTSVVAALPPPPPHWQFSGRLSAPAHAEGQSGSSRR